MRIVRNIAIIIAFAFKINAQTLPPNDSAYKIVFIDNFNVDTLNTNLWTQNPGYIYDNKQFMCDTIHKTDFAYRKWYKDTLPGKWTDTSNCKLSSGVLSIYTRKENFNGQIWSYPSCIYGGIDPQCNGNPCDTTNTCWHYENHPFKYTTSMLFSKYKFKYGYFEIKFMLPDTITAPNHVGPNFWLYGVSDLSPWSEIDIYELGVHDIVLSGGKNNFYTTTFHYEHLPDMPTHQAQGLEYGSISSNVWHTAAAWWRSDGIDVFLDGNLIHSLTNKNIRPDSMTAMNIFIDTNAPAVNMCDSFHTATDVFPHQYKVDYVKVWQLKEDCGTAKSYCSSLNPTTYNNNNALYQSVSIGGSGCSDVISATSYLDIQARDYIQLGEGFSIDGSSNVLIDTHECNESMYKATITPGPPPASYLQRMLPH